MEFFSSDGLKPTNYNRNNKKIKENQELETPEYFNLISEDDQSQYRELQKDLTSPENRYARNKRISTCQDAIKAIKNFCIRNDEDDWKRCLVCGVIWINDNNTKKDFSFGINQNNSIDNEEFISINIRQLIVILGKSKSSINGALVKMGFVTIPTKGENQELLYNAMPYFKGRYFEMRNWTIRKRKRTDEPTQEDNKKVDDEIPFINFYDQPNEEIKFDDVNFTMPEFLFTDFDFSNTSYDYTIITQNSGDFIIPPLMKKENKKEMSESFIYKTDDTFDPSFVIDFNEMGCGLINTIFHPLITQLLYQMYLMLIILNLNVPHLLFVNSM